MNKFAIIRLIIFSVLLLIILLLYSNLNYFNFSIPKVDTTLPKPKINVSAQNTQLSQGNITDATKLTNDLELVGIRGNNPNSTIIILDSGSYRLIRQGELVVGNIIFDRVDGSRAYFYNGREFSYLDIIGSEESFNKTRINLD